MKYLLLISIKLLFFITFAEAAKVTKDIVKEVNGIKIPITIYEPDKAGTNRPVVFHVHGGGWNGGTKTEVPDATALKFTTNDLCDRLGIIFVGLGYRCKNQDGTFQLAMEDLMDSVKWFEERAEKFGADVSKVGLSGASAGTPLSALLAQKLPNCSNYLGLWGVYDIVNNEESLFPDEKARGIYGLETAEKAKAASAFYHLKSPPPATLLLHGGKDILTHPAQSERFAAQIKSKGGKVTYLVYPEVNHNFLHPKSMQAYEDGILKIAQFYVTNFGIQNFDEEQLKKDLTTDTDAYQPLPELKKSDVMGTWRGKKESITIEADGTGTVVQTKGKNGNTSITWSLDNGFLVISLGKTQRRLQLRKSKRSLFEVATDKRKAGMHTDYSRRR